MRTKRLGNTDLELTVLGLGTWAIGGGGWDYAWGAQKDQDSIEAILEALECGVNWIDTAAAYGLGHSEEIVGKALKQWGKPVIIATKCGLLGDPDGHVRGYLKRESILKEAEASLKRLQVDRIDLYQIHWPNPAPDIEEAFETLIDLQKQGKIRYAGVSNFSSKQMEKISAKGPIASLQPPYSLLNRYAEKDLFPYCEKNSIGIVCYSPMQNGLLSGKMTRQRVEDMPADDWRKTKNDLFQEPQLSKVLNLVDKLKEFALMRGKTVAQAALSWVLRRREVTAAIVGARKKGQMAELAGASEWVLTGEEIEAIDAILGEFKRDRKK